VPHEQDTTLQHTVIASVFGLQQLIGNQVLLKLTVFGRQWLRFGVGNLFSKPSAMAAVFWHFIAKCDNQTSAYPLNRFSSL
jgi:hypothetical protein